MVINRDGVALNLMHHLENSMPKTGTTAPPRKNSTKTAPAATKNSSKAPAAAAKNSSKPATPAAAPSGSALEIKDGRTNKTYTVPVAENAIRATELKKI